MRGVTRFMRFFSFSDPWASVVILLTLGLFILSLAVKGFTHELLVEAGVFLVSVKLILMAGKNAAAEERMEQHLNQIKALLSGNEAPVGSKDETSADSKPSRRRSF